MKDVYEAQNDQTNDARPVSEVPHHDVAVLPPWYRRKVAMWQNESTLGIPQESSPDVPSSRPDTPAPKRTPVAPKPSQDRKSGGSSTSAKKRPPPSSRKRTRDDPAPNTDPPKRQLRSRTRSQVPRTSARPGGKNAAAKIPATVRAADDDDSDLDAQVVASMLTDSATDVI